MLRHSRTATLLDDLAGCGLPPARIQPHQWALCEANCMPQGEDRHKSVLDDIIMLLIFENYEECMFHS